MELKLNSHRLLVAGYDPPLVSKEPHGPEVLAEAILDWRRYRRKNVYSGDSEWLSPITDDGVDKLINLVCYSSLMPEEGRLTTDILTTPLMTPM